MADDYVTVQLMDANMEDVLEPKTVKVSGVNAENAVWKDVPERLTITHVILNGKLYELLIPQGVAPGDTVSYSGDDLPN